MAGKVSVLWYLCYPSCSATELPKLDMNNGPAIIMLGHSFYEHTTV